MLRSTSTWWVSLVLCTGWLVPSAGAGQNQSGAPAAEPVPIGKGVTTPKLIHKVEPEYSREASNAGVQGTLMLEIIVSEKGIPGSIQVLSPMGFGLDERAVRAVEQWRFEPGRKEGQPVPVLANVEVNFRLSGEFFDRKAEGQRTKFNLALRGLASAQLAQRAKSIKAMTDLSQARFPPAMYVHATLLERGDGMDRNSAQAEELIRKAASKNYGPALYAVGFARLKNARQPAEKAEALRMINDASILGTYNAQAFLGDASEKGTYGPVDLERAGRAFRLCATTGHSDCQYRLGKLLLDQSPRKERTLIQAFAWLQLAAGQGQPDAAALLKQEGPTLTADQAARVKQLKPQLQQKH
ncbi:MAG: TonB family protein [Acidobacteria bacterium]|nr:TonB family protein [Acidobacteriota bacterium]